MHTSTNILIAQQRELALQRARNGMATLPLVLETDRALASVTKDPFLDGLATQDMSAADEHSTAADVRRALHERQRGRVVASLLGIASLGRPNRRHNTNSPAATRC
jgi:hypothetical protein